MLSEIIGKKLCGLLILSLGCEAFTVPASSVLGFARPINIRHSTNPMNRNANTQCLKMAVAPPEEETSMEEEARQETIDLILDFAHKIDENPVGSLEEEDFEFIQPILRELESISESGEGIDGDNTLVAEIVEKLVGRLVDEWQYAIINDVEIDFVPDVSIFNMALNAWGRALGKKNHELVTERMNEILEEIKGYYDSGIESCRPDAISFNAKLRTIAFKRGKGRYDEEALAMYEEMKGFGVMPNSETFELLIKIFTGSRAKNSASIADNFLRQGVAMFPPQKGGIGIDSFNAVLYSWAKSDDRGSSTNIERILAMMDEQGVNPDVRSFTIYIDSFAQKNDWDSVKESENILWKLIDLYLAGELDFEPDVTCWTTVIRGWMRLSKRRRKAASLAEDVMERMIVLQDDDKITAKADAIVYLSVLTAYVYARSMEDAERILGTMEYLWKQGDEEMKPQVRSYTTLIDGWTQSPEEGAMSKAEAMVKRLVEIHEGCEDDVLTECYRSLLFGYSKNTNPLKAEQILRLIIEKGLKVDSILFDKVIESYSHLEDEVKNVYAVFELMESCQKQGLMQANERVYTALIRAIAKESKPGMTKKAQTIIRRMQQLYENGNETVLPTVFTYNALLKTCANSFVLDDDEKNKAFNIAIGTFNLLRTSEDLSPDYVTYSSLIKCSRLLPEGDKRDNLIIATFKQCAKDGMTNDVFVRALEECASEELSRKLIKALHIS